MTGQPLDLDAIRAKLERFAHPLPCDCDDGVSECYCLTSPSPEITPADVLALLDRVQELEAKVERLTSRGIEDLRAHNAELTAALEEIANFKLAHSCVVVARTALARAALAGGQKRGPA